MTVEKTVSDLVAKYARFNGDAINSTADIRETYGVDSLKIVELLTDVESLYDITIESSLLSYENFSTVRKIAAYIREKV
jgi:acyl carrier protein